MGLYIVGFVVCLANILLVRSQTYICENTTDELSCPNGQVINITHAFYGRENNTICPTNENGTSTAGNCSLPNATEIFSNLCNGAQNCTLFFNGSASDDFCPNVTKYWVVDYDCNNFSVPVCGRHEHYSPLACGCIDQCQTPDFSCEPFCSLAGGCVCNRGFKRDPITKTCVGEAYCPQGGNLSQTHEEYSDCADNQRTCRFPNWKRHVICVPGYQCVQGFIRDVYTSQCIRPDECPAQYRRWGK